MAGSQTQDLGLLQDFPGRSRRVVLCLTVMFAVNSSLAAGIHLFRLFDAGLPRRVLDFPSFFMAADAVFNHALSPYAAATRELYRAELGFPVLPFLYPPYALPALYPASLVDYDLAVVAALIVNTAVAAVLFRLLHDMFLAGVRNPVAYWSAMLLLFVGNSVQESVFVGQVNLIALLSLLLAWRLLRAGTRPFLAGLLLGVAVVTKTYFAVLLLMFLPRWSWRPIMGAVATVLAFTMAAAVLVPSSLWAEWLVDVAPTGRYGMTPFADMPSLFVANQSLNGILTHTLGAGGSALIGPPVACAMVIIVAILLWRRRAAHVERYIDCAMPLLLVTIYLIAPLSWVNHLVFVLPALLWLWADAAKRGSRPEMIAIGAVGLWIAIPWPIPDLAEVSPHLAFIPLPGVAALWCLACRRAGMIEAASSTPEFPIIDETPSTDLAAIRGRAGK